MGVSIVFASNLHMSPARKQVDTLRAPKRREGLPPLSLYCRNHPGVSRLNAGIDNIPTGTSDITGGGGIPRSRHILRARLLGDLGNLGVPGHGRTLPGSAVYVDGV